MDQSLLSQNWPAVALMLLGVRFAANIAESNLALSGKEALGSGSRGASWTTVGLGLRVKGAH